MALKTSDIRNQKKCRSRLLSEFDKMGLVADSAPAILTSSVPHAASAILTISAPDAASAILTSSAPDAASAILTSSAPDAASAILTSSAPDAAPAILTSSVPHAASAIYTSSAPDAASATLTSFAPDAESAILTSFAPDAASAIIISSVMDAASTFLTSFAPDAASCIRTRPALDVASAILTSSAPDAASTACNSTPPVSESNLLGISLRDVPSISFATSLNSNDSPTTKLSSEILNIANSESNVIRSNVSKQLLKVLPGTSSGTNANNTQASTFRITRPRKKDSYLDYMSDDELALLNAFGDAGSSDEWEPEGNGKKRKKMTLEKEENDSWLSMKMVHLRGHSGAVYRQLQKAKLAFADSVLTGVKDTITNLNIEDLMMLLLFKLS
ncbi:unnamed protein product, partial [Brenthis ino]